VTDNRVFFFDATASINERIYVDTATWSPRSPRRLLLALAGDSMTEMKQAPPNQTAPYRSRTPTWCGQIPQSLLARSGPGRSPANSVSGRAYSRRFGDSPTSLQAGLMHVWWNAVTSHSAMRCSRRANLFRRSLQLRQLLDFYIPRWSSRPSRGTWHDWCCGPMTLAGETVRGRQTAAALRRPRVPRGRIESASGWRSPSGYVAVSVDPNGLSTLIIRDAARRVALQTRASRPSRSRGATLINATDLAPRGYVVCRKFTTSTAGTMNIRRLPGLPVRWSRPTRDCAGRLTPLRLA